MTGSRSASPAGLVQLLFDRRFAPHFLTQFLGAFNDNVFKQGLVIFIAFQAASGSSTQSAQLVTVAAGIFILPFLVASPVAGQLADKLPKTRLIQLIKWAEVAIMLVGAVAFWLQDVWFLLAVLFIMGAQSSTFGPLKYGILPQLIERVELPAGNALVQGATYVAILLGTLFGGFLMAGEDLGWSAVSVAVVVLAGLGVAASYFMREVPAAVPALVIDWNIWRQGWVAVAFARQPPVVFAAIIGISWFWLLGATFLQLLPTYGRDVLGGDIQVVTLLLITFSVGIGVGALLSATLMRFSRPTVLVLVGALGMALCGSLPLLLGPSEGGAMADAGSRALAAVLQDASIWPVLVGFCGLAIFGGVFVVPLVVTMQIRSDLERRSRVVAANNILNALFMVASAALSVALLEMGWSMSAIMSAASVSTVIAALFVVKRVAQDHQ